MNEWDIPELKQYEENWQTRNSLIQSNLIEVSYTLRCWSHSSCHLFQSLATFFVVVRVFVLIGRPPGFNHIPLAYLRHLSCSSYMTFAAATVFKSFWKFNFLSKILSDRNKLAPIKRLWLKDLLKKT